MLYKIRLEEKSPLMQGKSGGRSHNVSRMPPPMPAPVRSYLLRARSHLPLLLRIRKHRNRRLPAWHRPVPDLLQPPRGLLGTATTDFGALDVNPLTPCHLQRITHGKCHTFKNCLDHIGSACIHGHAHKACSGKRVIVR